MVAKVNGAIAAGSVVGHDLAHFTIAGDDMSDAAKATHVIETIEQKATVVLIGTLGTSTRVAVETPNGWTASALQTALGGSWTAADFTY